MAYREVSVWLEDVLISIERIKQHIQNINSFSEYKKSQLIIDATDRNLEIIAEAIKNASKLKPDISISNIPKIIGIKI